MAFRAARRPVDAGIQRVTIFPACLDFQSAETGGSRCPFHSKENDPMSRSIFAGLGRGAAQSRRLFLEQLENRTLLATITVTSVADDLLPNDGSVSLREAITSINAGNDLGDPSITNQ